MDIFRRILKRGIMQTRGKIVSEKNRTEWRPICGYCGNAILEDPDMNEVFIRKQDVRLLGELEASALMENVCNCVLVHRECHVPAHTKEGKVRCVRQIIKYEGEDTILDYLETCSRILSVDMDDLKYIVEKAKEQR